MADEHYEVTVIGGGIHGAGVAQAAAAAGYRTLIIEQRDWAAETSSRSSKLLHGGLRYLETAQFGLVRESLRERNLLLQLAPTLAHPLRFNIPVYRDTRRRPWQLVLGLSLYALLSGLSSLSRFSIARSAHAALRTQGLQKVFRYWDGQTDDVQLTRAVIRSAQENGAELLCPAKLLQAQQQADGYLLTVQEGRAADDAEQPLPSRQLQTDYLVNCSGPWINQVLGLVAPLPQQRNCELVKGSHLVIREKISSEAFYLEAPADGRAIFLLPWGENSLLGTTEQPFRGDDPQAVAVSPQERAYLLETAHHYFPTSNFTVMDEFAGLRVLPSGDNRAFERPRDCVLHSDPMHPALLSLYGGKLTTYRKTADKVLQQIRQQLGPRPSRVTTDKLPLQG